MTTTPVETRFAVAVLLAKDAVGQDVDVVAGIDDRAEVWFLRANGVRAELSLVEAMKAYPFLHAAVRELVRRFVEAWKEAGHGSQG